MNKFEEFATAWADAFPCNPFDPAAAAGSARRSAETGEALTLAVLRAADSCTDLTGKWSLDSLSRVRKAVSAGHEPAEIAKTAKDWASSTVESAAEHLAAYTEIAKRAQIESAEIVLGSAK